MYTICSTDTHLLAPRSTLAANYLVAQKTLALQPAMDDGQQASVMATAALMQLTRQLPFSPSEAANNGRNGE